MIAWSLALKHTAVAFLGWYVGPSMMGQYPWKQSCPKICWDAPLENALRPPTHGCKLPVDSRHCEFATSLPFAWWKCLAAPEQWSRRFRASPLFWLSQLMCVAQYPGKLCSWYGYCWGMGWFPVTLPVLLRIFWNTCALCRNTRNWDSRNMTIGQGLGARSFGRSR